MSTFMSFKFMSTFVKIWRILFSQKERSGKFCFPVYVEKLYSRHFQDRKQDFPNRFVAFDLRQGPVELVFFNRRKITKWNVLVNIFCKTIDQ